MGIGLFVALFGFFNTDQVYDPSATDWESVGLSIAQIAGLFMLIANGTFILSKYYKFIKLPVALYVIGLLFVIEHWPYANIILIATVCSIILIYSLSFIAKPSKEVLDYTKLLWVITYFGYALLKYFHLLREEYQLISTACLWTSIGLYLIQEAQVRKQSKH